MTAWVAALALRRDPYLDPTVAEELTHRGIEVEHVSFQPGDSLDVLEHGDVEPETRDVQEMTALDAANVDHHVRAVHRETRRRREVPRRCTDRFREVVARSGGEQSQPSLPTRARGDDRVRDVAPGPVASTGDDRIEPIVEGLTSVRALTALGAREANLGNADGRERRTDGRKRARAGSPSGSRIYNDADLVAHAGINGRDVRCQNSDF